MKNRSRPTTPGGWGWHQLHLTVTCSICGAAPGEVCTGDPGAFGSEPGWWHNPRGTDALLVFDMKETLLDED